LIDKETEWEEMVDRQREYSNELDDISVKKMQEKYNLSVEDWEILKCKFLIKEFKNNGRS
jgi:hypothetical protein